MRMKLTVRVPVMIRCADCDEQKIPQYIELDMEVLSELFKIVVGIVFEVSLVWFFVRIFIRPLSKVNIDIK